MRVTIQLQKLLDEKGMSQNQLARSTGIRQPSITEMCKNQTQRIPLKNLAAICSELECDIQDILKLEKEQSD